MQFDHKYTFFSELPEAYAGIMPAETERIGESEGEVRLDGLVGRIVEVALGVGAVEVDGRRNDPLLEGEDRRDGFRRACGAEHVAVHRLSRTDVALVREVAEGDLDGVGLSHVVELGAGAVGVDIDRILGRVEAGLADSDRDALRLGAAVRARSRHVIGIASAAVCDHLGIYLRTASDSVLIFLKDEHASAVGAHESRPVGVERQGGVIGILRVGQGLGIGKCRQADGDRTLVGTAGDDGIGVAVLHRTKRLAEGVGGGGASRRHVDARAGGIVPDGDIARSDVGDHRRDEERGNPLAGRVFEELADLTDLDIEASDTGAHIDSQTERIDVPVITLGMQSGVIHGLLRSSHAVDGEPVLLAHERLVDAVDIRIESLDPAAYLYRQVVRREIGDGLDAADSVLEVVPESRDVVPD